MHAILLHNPGAGTGGIAADDLLAALADGGVRARYCSAKSPDFPAALRQPVDLVVVAGGDGTVAKAVGHLCERNVPIAILPLGSANNIARSLGIEGDAIEMARGGWRQDEVRRLDIGLATGPWGKRLFVEAVGVGVLAEAAAVMDREDAGGPERSRRAREVLHAMLADAQPQEAVFLIDGRARKISFLLAEMMNIKLAGPRLLLAPDAQTGDGRLDLVYVEEEGRAELLSWMESPSEGAAPVSARRGRRFVFAWGSGRLHVDDEFHCPPARPHRIEVDVLPDPVTVLMPAT